MKRFSAVFAIPSLLILSACGGGGSSPPPPQPVGGRVSGLAGSGLVLQNNAGDDLAVSANGTFTFAAPVGDGLAYSVSVLTQPTDLRCVVENGSGTVSGAPVASVVVTCPLAVRGPLTWMRCTHGQHWNSQAGDCTGTGGAGGGFGATAVQFCSVSDNSCNAGVAGGTLGTPSGGATSSLFQACSDLNSGGGTYGIGSWRVPTKDELKGLVVCTNGPAVPLADFSNCAAGSASPVLDGRLFPDTVTGAYLSSTSMDMNYAYGVYFTNGFTNNEPKLYVSDFVRCVAGP